MSDTKTPPQGEADQTTLPAISTAKVKKLKADGDFISIEKLIRSGQLEIVPTEEFKKVISERNKYRDDLTTLLMTMTAVVKGSEGLANNGHIIQRYVNFGPDGKPKVNFMAIAGEMGPIMMGGSFEKTGIAQLFLTSIDVKQFDKIPLEDLQKVVEKYKIDIQPYINLAATLGFKK